MPASIVALPTPESRRSYLSRRYTPVTRSVVSGFAPTDLTWPQVRAVLLAHDQGAYHASAPLISEMLRDERIASHLSTLVSGVLRLPLTHVGPDDEVRSAWASAWSRLSDDGALVEWIETAVLAGEAWASVEWDTSNPSRWVPTCIRPWSNDGLYVDLTTGIRRMTTMEGVVELNPDACDGKWLCLRLGGGDRPWLRGAVRSLAQPWMARAYARRDWLRASEKLGLGILKVHVPADADPADKDAFFEAAANLPNEPTIQVSKPSDGQGDGYDVSLMEAAREPGESFEKLLLRCEADMAVRLLGQNASTETPGVYVAASGIFGRVTQARIDALVGPLEHTIRHQLAAPFAELNFSGGASRVAYPDWDSIPPPDKAQQAQTLVTLSQSIASLSSAGYELDLAEVSQRFGLTIRPKP